MQGTFQRMISLLNQPLISARTMRERRRKRHSPNKALGNSLTNSQESVVLRGELSAGINTQYAVEGKDIIVTGDTWVFGDLLIGMGVAAQCVRRPDGGLVAKKIVLTD